MKRVAILGLGLMGGSLGLALRARRPRVRVAGYARRPATRRLALRQGAVDEVFDRPELAVRGADVTFLCVPILAIPRLVRACRKGFSRRCIVTDVGSTKSDLERAVRPLLKGTPAVWVGSHPIAGSEQQGLKAARRGLYRGAVVVVTAGKRGDRRAVEEVARFWQTLGARVEIMTAKDHDRMMARTSHLPHLVAAVLADTVGRGGSPAEVGRHCGPGFRDTTRIADGSPEVWHDIIRSNREAVANELRAFGKAFDELASLIRAGRFKAVQQVLERARARRRALMRKPKNRSRRAGA